MLNERVSVTLVSTLVYKENSAVFVFGLALGETFSSEEYTLRFHCRLYFVIMLLDYTRLVDWSLIGDLLLVLFRVEGVGN